MLKVDFFLVGAEISLGDLDLFGACPEIEEADWEETTAPDWNCAFLIDKEQIRAAYFVWFDFMLTDGLVKDGLDVCVKRDIGAG